LRFSYLYFQSFREQARAQVLEFKLQEAEPGRDSKDFEFWNASDEDAYKQWHKKYGASARDLGYSRSIVVDAASKMRELLVLSVGWMLIQKYIQSTCRQRNDRGFCMRP